MTSVVKIIAKMRRGDHNIRYYDLYKVCLEKFGEPRENGGSHVKFEVPWHGTPRPNIQNFRGKAKPYQVEQVLKAIDKLERMEREKEPHTSYR